MHRNRVSSSPQDPTRTLYAFPEACTSPVKEGRWTIIGSRPDLLAATTIPELRASYDIFYKDTAVRHVILDEFRNYPELRVAGGAFVENRLRVVLE